MKILKNKFLIIILLLNTQLVFSQWELTYTFTSYFAVIESNISFSNQQNGYAYYEVDLSSSSGSKICISKTTDSGNSWNIIDDFNGYFSVSEIVSTHPDTVYYLLNNEGITSLVYSYDSGTQWENKQIDVNYPVDLFFINSDTGYVITSGYNANKLTKFTLDSLYTLINTDTINLTYSKIFFVNSQIGYLTAKDTSNNNILLFTDDGGVSWNTNYTSPEYVFNNLFFTSDSVGYIACSSGKILKTNDFGMNLTELAISTTSNLNDIQFVNDSCGHCIGDDGVSVYTTDSGDTWSYDTINTSENLLKVQMFDLNNGYILSSNNKLFSKNINNSISTYNDEPFSIYPNPTSGYLYLSLDSKTTIDNISIYNMQGQKLLSKDINIRQIEMSKFKKGLYFIEISIGNNRYLKKIIKI